MSENISNSALCQEMGYFEGKFYVEAAKMYYMHSSNKQSVDNGTNGNRLDSIETKFYLQKHHNSSFKECSRLPILLLAFTTATS